MKNEEALGNVRKKIAEKLKKDDQRLVFGWRGEPEPTRKEGDMWEDATGKKWTIKNGIRQTVTKLDSAKTPYWCPRCTKPLNHRFDVKFWRIRGHCMDCVISDESKIRQEGKWEEYERKLMLRNFIANITDKIDELQNYHDTFTKPEFIDADDTKILMVERWDVDVDKVKSDIMADINELKRILEEKIQQYGTGEEDETKGEEVSGINKTNG